MDYSINIVMEDNTEKEVEVEIGFEELGELETQEEKLAYIEEITRQQFSDIKIKTVDFYEEDLEDLENEVDSLCDTSIFHPNETYEEFMEHEDY